MNSKFYVSLEAARLLKEKRYNEECISYYHDNCREVNYSFCGERNSTWEGRCVSAPSKAEAIDWLDNKGIVVELNYDYQAHMDNARWEYFIYTHDKDGWLETVVCSRTKNNYYKTRLEAEEAAIIKSCELLKGKEE